MREPHAHCLAALQFPDYLWRDRLRDRSGRFQACFGKLVRGSGAAEVQLGRVLFRAAQDEVARGEKSLEFLG